MKAPTSLPVLPLKADITSEVGQIAIAIPLATTYLLSLIDPADKKGKRHLYNQRHLRNLTGGGDKNGKGGNEEDRLHKNSILKIWDLRKIWAVPQPINPTLGRAYRKACSVAGGTPTMKKPKMHWIEAKEGASGFMGESGRYQWLWNPEVSTFEKLELILAEARRRGFDAEVVKMRQAA
jgi:hypothetical protein